MADGALADSKKAAAREGRTIVWVDESGFSLLPAVVRSLAPRGHPPTQRFPGTREHLSVISGITPTGRLLLQIQDQAFRTPDVVQFLHHLLSHLPGKVLVIWDGAPIHRGRPIKEFLSQVPPNDCASSNCPATHPTSIQMRGSGTTSSTSSYATSAAPTWTNSTDILRLVTARLRHKRAVIRGCVTHCGYAL